MKSTPENRFLDIMRKHSDDELLEILNIRRMDYTAEAIAAVEEVLHERGLSYKKNRMKILKKQFLTSTR